MNEQIKFNQISAYISKFRAWLEHNLGDTPGFSTAHPVGGLHVYCKSATYSDGNFSDPSKQILGKYAKVETAGIVIHAHERSPICRQLGSLVTFETMYGLAEREFAGDGKPTSTDRTLKSNALGAMTAGTLRVTQSHKKLSTYTYTQDLVPTRGSAREGGTFQFGYDSLGDVKNNFFAGGIAGLVEFMNDHRDHTDWNRQLPILQIDDSTQ